MTTEAADRNEPLRATSPIETREWLTKSVDISNKFHLREEMFDVRIVHQLVIYTQTAYEFRLRQEQEWNKEECPSNIFERRNVGYKTRK